MPYAVTRPYAGMLLKSFRSRTHTTYDSIFDKVHAAVLGSSKLRTPRRSWEGDHIADISHAGNEEYEALQT